MSLNTFLKSNLRAFLMTLLFCSPFLTFAQESSEPTNREMGVSQIDPQATEKREAIDGIGGTVAPMFIDSALFAHPSPSVRDMAMRVASGQASMPEIRAFWQLRKMLFPFQKAIPNNWQQEAMRKMDLLAPQSGDIVSDVPLPSATTYNWTAMGPYGLAMGAEVDSGRATSILVDPVDNDIYYLGTASGGIWKSLDAGLNWTPIFEDTLSLAIGCMAMDPNDRNTIYVGTGEGNFSLGEIAGVGIYKSTDAGANWTLQTLPWPYAQPDHTLRRIIVDPRDSQRVYAAGDGGLFYSLDGGTNWSLTTCGASGGSLLIGTDVVLDSINPAGGSPSVIYAAMGYQWGDSNNGVYRASAGATGSWTNISGLGSGFPSAGVGRVVLVQSPSSPENIYGFIASSGGDMLGVWRTTDAGAPSVSWSTESNSQMCGGQCFYNLHGVVEPSDPDRLYLGGLQIYHSRNGGGSFSQKSSGGSTGTGYSHVDQHFLTMPNATTLLAANDGGLFRGTIGGNQNNVQISWESLNVGVPTLQFMSISQHPTDPTLYMGGTQDNGMAHFDGSSWQEVWFGDGIDTAWDQDQPNYGYVTHIGGSVSRNNTLDTNPSSWTCIRNFGGCNSCSPSCRPDGRGDITPIILDANDQNTMYAGSYRMWRNSAVRTSNSWSSLDGDVTDGDLTNGGVLVEIHSAKNGGTSGTLYTGSHDGKVFMTSNDGTNWLDRTAGLPTAWIDGFATHPADGTQVLVVLNGFGHPHVFRSLQSGQNWVDISGGLPDMPYNDVLIDPSNPNTAYLAGEMGVFVNTDVWNSDSWTNITANLPVVKATEFRIHPVSGKVRMSTYGRGFFELTQTVTASVPQEASPSGDLIAVKGSGSQVDVTFSDACGGTDHTVYVGDLSSLQSGGLSWSERYCAMGIGGSLNFDPATNEVLYFVVVANDGSDEGSYGQDSTGTERTAAGAGGSCQFSQNLSGSCS